MFLSLVVTEAAKKESAYYKQFVLGEAKSGGHH